MKRTREIYFIYLLGATIARSDLVPSTDESRSDHARDLLRFLQLRSHGNYLTLYMPVLRSPKGAKALKKASVARYSTQSVGTTYHNQTHIPGCDLRIGHQNIYQAITAVSSIFRWQIKH